MKGADPGSSWWGRGGLGLRRPRKSGKCMSHPGGAGTEFKPLDFYMGLPDKIQDAQVNLNFR